MCVHVRVRMRVRACVSALMKTKAPSILTLCCCDWFLPLIWSSQSLEDQSPCERLLATVPSTSVLHMNLYWFSHPFALLIHILSSTFWVSYSSHLSLSLCEDVVAFPGLSAVLYCTVQNEGDVKGCLWSCVHTTQGAYRPLTSLRTLLADPSCVRRKGLTCASRKLSVEATQPQGL